MVTLIPTSFTVIAVLLLQAAFFSTSTGEPGDRNKPKNLFPEGPSTLHNNNVLYSHSALIMKARL